MKFIIAIERDKRAGAFGVAVPDLPGCFSVGGTLDQAIDNARDAISFHCETMIEDGLDIPPRKSIAEHQVGPVYAGWIWAVVDVPLEKYLGPAEKINITIPRLLLSRINSYAKSHGTTLSGFLIEAARQAMH